MRSHHHRVLSEYNITPAQWAIIFSASYYLPSLPEQFIIEAQLESEENFSETELTDALDECLGQGWICQANLSRIEHLSAEVGPDLLNWRENGIVLTDVGHQIKEEVSHSLMETVEIN